jgi:hypothetical protein
LAHGFQFRLRFAEFGEELEGAFGFRGIDAAHGEADMDQHPVADTGFRGMLVIDDAGDVDLAPHAADVDGGEAIAGVVDADDLAGYA